MFTESSLLRAKLKEIAASVSVFISLVAFFGGTSTEAIDLAKDSSVGSGHGGTMTSWKHHPIKYYLDAGKEVRYCEFETDDHNKVHMIVVPFRKSTIAIEPVANTPVCTTLASCKPLSALAGVNGGYFNLHGGLSASYVTIKGQTACDPKDNTMLVANGKLKPFLDAVYNRSELRMLVNKAGKPTLRIQNHTEPVADGYTLKHALQAGPRLLPKLMAREEAFLRTDASGVLTDAIGVMKTAARTAVGITADDHALFVCIAGPKQDEFSSGMTLAQLADLLKSLGCVEAINLDGGTSTTMIIKTPKDKADSEKSAENLEEAGYTMVCGREPQTIVKSALVIKSEP